VITESDLVVSWSAKPRGFVALMGLYESNYLRLVRLAGSLRELAGVRVSEVPGDCTLLLSVLERSPYTAELLLTYLLPAAAPAAPLERVPDLRLRVYHDARLLEVRQPDAVGPERELRRCWTRNMMLNKWLEYCSERGHRFLTAPGR
jgi:uncharacterized protein YqiB (DUF1249 family)